MQERRLEASEARDEHEAIRSLRQSQKEKWRQRGAELVAERHEAAREVERRRQESLVALRALGDESRRERDTRTQWVAHERLLHERHGASLSEDAARRREWLLSERTERADERRGAVLRAHAEQDARRAQSQAEEATHTQQKRECHDEVHSWGAASRAAFLAARNEDVVADAKAERAGMWAATADAQRANETRAAMARQSVEEQRDQLRRTMEGLSLQRAAYAADQRSWERQIKAAARADMDHARMLRFERAEELRRSAHASPTQAREMAHAFANDGAWRNLSQWL
jgi:hypothetical protein